MAMIHRSDVTTADALGTPSPGIYITVLDVNGDVADIRTSDGGAVKANPFMSGTDGTFDYWANEGSYTEEYRHGLGGQPTQVVGVKLAATLHASDIATTLAHTAQDELDRQRAAGIDVVDFGDGAVPAYTAFGRPVNERVNGPAGTLTRGFDADGFYVNTDPAGRGGSYIVVDAGAPVVYLSGEFILKDMAGATPQFGSFLMQCWTADITQGTYAVPYTALHAGFSQTLWNYSAYSPDFAFASFIAGPFPNGFLELDVVHTVEVAIVDSQVYTFIDGALIRIIPLESDAGEAYIGNFAGYEIFKTNGAGDSEPGMRRLAFSTNPAIARQIRDRYLRQQHLEAATSPSDAFSVRDDFIFGSLETGEVGLLGWSFSNFTLAEGAGVSDHPGIVYLTTAATSGTVNSFYAGSSTTALRFRLSDFSAMEWCFQEAGAGYTNLDLRVGVFSTLAAASSGNGVYLEALHGDTTWRLVYFTGGVATRVDTGVACHTADWITVKIYNAGSGVYSAAIKVNGVSAGDDISVTTGSIGIQVQPGLMAIINDTTARGVNLDFFSLSMNGTTR